jgi:hypothetical protein
MDINTLLPTHLLKKTMRKKIQNEGPSVVAIPESDAEGQLLRHL